MPEYFSDWSAVLWSPREQDCELQSFSELLLVGKLDHLKKKQTNKKTTASLSVEQGV